MIRKFTRKFRDVDNFRDSINEYYLLPFKFQKINNQTEVLVNETGDFLFCPVGTATRIAKKEVNYNDPLYSDLISNFFISEKPIPDLIDILATKYRTKKSFLDDFTSLHILVMTIRCNQRCTYCQVSSTNDKNDKYDISFSNLKKVIQCIFKSPSQNLTIEFQGGEPLLVWDKVKFAIEKISEVNLLENRNITFVLCTNLSLINYEILEFCKKFRVLISTSYDGPEFIHNANRPISDGNSHQNVLKGIKMARDILGFEKVSALMTASNRSLNYPKEIVDDYVKQGFKTIFLRQLNPFGLAWREPIQLRTGTDKFLDFYKKALFYIIELNKNGIYFVEEYASLVLTKMLSPFPIGFTDLQSPAGIINSVIVFNYDGYVYVSDEARMLAEKGEYHFRLGHLQQDSYKNIFYGVRSKQISRNWSNEGLAGCSECGFQFYCGADPVRNYSTQGDMYGDRPTNLFCKKNFSIIKLLFKLLCEDKDTEKIFYSWVSKKEL